MANFFPFSYIAQQLREKLDLKPLLHEYQIYLLQKTVFRYEHLVYKENTNGLNVVKGVRDIGKDFREIPNLCISQTVIENRNLNINLDKVVATNGRVVYLYERGKENKIIEQYSIKNYFTKVLINYDPSKISFINL